MGILMLKTQLLDIPVATGIDEKTDRRVVARMRELVNCRVLKTGAVAKRAGTRCIAPYNERFAGGTPPTPELLATFGDELVRLGAGELDSYLSLDASDHVARGRYPATLVRRTPVSPFGQYDSDVAAVGDYRVVVYLSRNELGNDLLCADVIHAETGARLQTREMVFTVSAGQIANCKVVGVGDTAAIAGVRAGTNIYFAAFDLATVTWTTNINLITNCAAATTADGKWDMCSAAGGVAVVAEDSGGPGGPVNVYLIDTALTITASRALSAATTGHTALAIENAEADGYFLVGLGYDASGATVDVVIVTSDLSSEQSGPDGAIDEADSLPTNITFVRMAPATYAVVATLRLASGINPSRLHWNFHDDFGVMAIAANATPKIKALALISRAWEDGGRLRAAAVNAHTTHGTGVIVDLGTTATRARRIESIFAPRQMSAQAGSSIFGANYRRSWSSLSSVPVDGSGSRLFAFMTEGASSLAYHRKVEIGTTGSGVSTADTGRSCAIGGGVPSIYDRQRAAECGFLHEPEAPTLSASIGLLGQLTLLTSYSVRLVYAWTDANGDTHRSAPSAAAQVTLSGSNNQVGVSVIESLHLTNRVYALGDAPVLIEVYRTEGNGSIFYLDTALTSTVNGASQTTTLQQPDSTLRSGLRLYTTGNVLDHVIPPSGGVVHAHQGAVVLGDTDDGRVWISFPVVEGDGLAWSDELVLPPFEGGPVTAFASLDDTLVIFKADSIWIVSGTLPGENGLPIPSVPRRLQSDIGCTQPRSIVNIPDGVLFMSRAGYALLDRGFGVSPVGKQVEDMLATSATSEEAATITSAVAMPSESVARVTFGQNAANYDYYNGNSQQPFWTKNVYEDPTAEDVSVDIASACLWRGRWTYINFEGRIFQEALDTWRDEGPADSYRFVSMTGKTQPINVAGVGGFQRCRRLRTLFQSHGDAVDFTFGLLFEDEDPAVEEVRAFTVIAGEAVNLQREKHIGRQKSRSFCVTFRDDEAADGTVTGRGVDLVGFQAELGVKKGTAKLPATSRG